VTKNIYFAANWIFNVHVWDTSAPPVGTQIGQFDLSSVFNPMVNSCRCPGTCAPGSSVRR